MARDLGESSKALTRRVPVATRAVGGVEGMVAGLVIGGAGTGILEVAHAVPAHLSTLGTGAFGVATLGAAAGLVASPQVTKATKAAVAKAKKALHL